HPETLRAMADLATSVAKSGLPLQARQLRQEVYERWADGTGPEGREALRALGDLAATFAEQEALDEALQIGRQVLEARERRFGADDPETLIAQANLALIFKKRGDLAGALQLEEYLLSAQRQRVGPAHLDTLRAANNYALTLSSAGRHAEALEQITTVLHELESYESPDPTLRLSFEDSQAEILRRRGRASDLEEAQAIQERVMRSAAELMPPLSPRAALWRQTLLRIYQSQGRTPEDSVVRAFTADFTQSLEDAAATPLGAASANHIARELAEIESALRAVEAGASVADQPEQPDLVERPVLAGEAEAVSGGAGQPLRPYVGFQQFQELLDILVRESGSLDPDEIHACLERTLFSERFDTSVSNQLKHALRYLGLMEPSGDQPLPALIDLLNAMQESPSARQAALTELARKQYALLFNFGSRTLHATSNADLTRDLERFYAKSVKQAVRVRRFFLQLCYAAGLRLPPGVGMERRRRAVSRRAVATRAVSTVEAAPAIASGSLVKLMAAFVINHLAVMGDLAGLGGGGRLRIPLTDPAGLLTLTHFTGEYEVRFAPGAVADIPAASATITHYGATLATTAGDLIDALGLTGDGHRVIDAAHNRGTLTVLRIGTEWEVRHRSATP
ncbi:MAG: tetratricopeptide repeat protein, partial [bacterium]